MFETAEVVMILVVLTADGVLALLVTLLPLLVLLALQLLLVLFDAELLLLNDSVFDLAVVPLQLPLTLPLWEALVEGVDWVFVAPAMSILSLLFDLHLRIWNGEKVFLNKLISDDWLRDLDKFPHPPLCWLTHVDAVVVVVFSLISIGISIGISISLFGSWLNLLHDSMVDDEDEDDEEEDVVDGDDDDGGREDTILLRLELSNANCCGAGCCCCCSFLADSLESCLIASM